ncbi:hypothetical protein [Kocuria tytonicola]|uniref:hypothetical protein n=1 Tax=Kocuria tytonicola TaxID=2055946 RepID=UPI000F51A82B|nr:hypothetical protein [Kocuria tytonicola]
MKSGVWLPHVLSAAALTTTAVLCLSSCGAPDETSGVHGASPQSASPTGTGLHPGVFKAELPNGASVRITVPARRVPDERLEQLRREAGVPRATYATVDIDNRSGRSPVSASRLVLTARDGATYQLEHVSRAVKRWQPRASGGGHVTPSGTTLDAEAAQTLRNRICATARGASGDIPVGERGRNILVGDVSGIPDSFASLELVPLIGDRESAPVQGRPEGSTGTSGEPGHSDGPGEGGPPGGGGDESSRAPAGDIPPENPLPEDPQPTGPASPAVPPDPAVPPGPVGPVVPDPVNPPPVVPDPIVPNPIVPDPDPVPTVPPVPEPPVPEPTVPGEALPDPVVPTIDPPAPGVAAAAPESREKDGRVQHGSSVLGSAGTAPAVSCLVIPVPVSPSTPGLLAAAEVPDAVPGPAHGKT